MNMYLKNKSHWIGFLLSLFLTFIPFYTIQYECFDKKTLLIMTICCAIIQIYIHLVYFLHLGQMPHLAWNVIS